MQAPFGASLGGTAEGHRSPSGEVNNKRTLNEKNEKTRGNYVQRNVGRAETQPCTVDVFTVTVTNVEPWQFNGSPDGGADSVRRRRRRDWRTGSSSTAGKLAHPPGERSVALSEGWRA